jgi:predicted nucleotidyltransferase
MKKILGLVLELNPIHNGHYYFLKEAQRRVEPELTIVVISGNYTMRGDVSVLDKFTKTRLALASGVDLVMELPFSSAVNSADYFGYNAIKILTSMQITDLAFGVELDKPEKLIRMKEIIDQEEFQEEIKKELKKGLSYPTSAYRALQKLSDDEEIINHFSLPNNTLGIQYLRALDELGVDIRIELIKRIANNYYDKNLTGNISSATAIRELLLKGEEIYSYVPDLGLKPQYLNQIEAEKRLLLLLKYLFTLKFPEDFRSLWGVNEGIEMRIAGFIDKSTDYQNLIRNIQTKRYPQNKIKRLLLHILLNTKKNFENQKLSYLRVLGSNQKGLKYIRKLPKDIKSEIITTFKNQENILIQSELKATKLYGLLSDRPELIMEEYKIPIITGGKNDN